MAETSMFNVNSAVLHAMIATKGAKNAVDNVFYIFKLSDIGMFHFCSAKIEIEWPNWRLSILSYFGWP